ncbi:MAG: aminopeptidase P family protein [Chromatiales bacterium]|jgi:Xaa-Pro dipeptidase|nr:aminopeptidase P family protein [Chromatiales bacterium]
MTSTSQVPPPDPPTRGFENAEYQHRLACVQTCMATEQLGAILLTTEADIRYFTGFLTQFWQSPTRPWFVVLPSVGKPIAVIPEIGVSCMRNGWMEDVRSWSSPHKDDDGVSLLTDALLEVLSQADGPRRIGINQGRETHIRMPYLDFQRLSTRLTKDDPETLFVDATHVMRSLRMRKSEMEIAKVEFVAQAVSGVFETLFDFVDVGMRDDDIFRAFKIACLKAGVDDVAYLVGAADQGGYDDIISPPSGRVLRQGDVLILDTGSTFDGYFCDFDRNYGFGKVNDAAKRAYEVVWQATESGLQAAKPGNRCSDIFQAMDSVMQAGGAQGDSVGRYGHGLGLQLTEPPSHTSWDDTLLEEGMVITLEPGMLFAPHRMMVHEENIVIRAQGPQLLSRRARSELPVKS